ncbi:M1 family metallopeptidase [Deinococcus sp. KNUC1210]|uniref:M1 family metallopeptidase n=1 Tax=Deinococcus sp. KNUC1210 TaxID=2917691 RepID=UPI001EF12B08|nr:M1 family metallopeptidase [Deinococcus sp. KNUC1210]ULH16574.1 M1 family metallopeptidase [Deinococcus sp. KNUC1210]
MPRRSLLAALLLAVLGSGAAQVAPAVSAVPPVSSLPAGFSVPAGAGDSIYPALGTPGLDVTHYDLSIRSDPRIDTLSGQAVLNITALSDLNQIALDFAGPTTSEVLLNDQVARFAQVGEKLLILPSTPLKAGTRFTLGVTYQGTPALHLDLGLRLGWITQDDASYTYSEPDAAHTYFPCNDLPADGASFTLHLDVPAGYTAVASGVQTGQHSQNGRTVTDFDLPQETATYALGIQVGRLDVVTRPRAGNVALRDAFPTDTPPSVRAPFARVADMLSVLTGWFGPYPFAVYGVALTHDPQLLALETATLSTFPAREQGEEVGLHELAHQWFGDSVRLGDWSDVWLNEGFATYAELLWAEHLGQDSRSLLRRWYTALMRQAARPLVATAAPQLFDSTSYQRGALTLHVLRLKIGDASFRRVLQQYAASYAGRSARTADFLNVVREVSGQTAVDALQPWVSSPSLPPLPRILKKVLART